MMDRTELLLKRLTEAPGVSGYEQEIRKIMREELPAGAVVEQDKIGSLIARLAGAQPAPKVMLAGHMDEVGFMVRHITDEGCLKFVSLGGWWDQVMLAQRVVVKTHKGDVVGILGAKPPHLIPKEERNKMVEKRDMYIDIGARSVDEVKEAGVRLGDPIIPVSDFTILANPKTYLSKAWETTVWVARWCSRRSRRWPAPAIPIRSMAVGTVMEEVGLRGARTTAFTIAPDVAIVLESDIPRRCARHQARGIGHQIGAWPVGAAI